MHSTPKRSTVLAGALVLSAALAGCGMGGEDEEQTAPPAPSTVAEPASPSASAPVPSELPEDKYRIGKRVFDIADLEESADPSGICTELFGSVDDVKATLAAAADEDVKDIFGMPDDARKNPGPGSAENVAIGYDWPDQWTLVFHENDADAPVVEGIFRISCTLTAPQKGGPGVYVVDGRVGDASSLDDLTGDGSGVVRAASYGEVIDSDGPTKNAPIETAGVINAAWNEDPHRNNADTLHLIPTDLFRPRLEQAMATF